MKQGVDARILVVDDHIEMARLIGVALKDVGYTVDVAESCKEALAKARLGLPDAVITDLRMERSSGFEVLDGIHQIDPLIPVIIMTAFGSVDNAIEAIKQGAFHYLTKPFQIQELLVYLEKGLADKRLKHENRSLNRFLSDQTHLNTMIGRSPPMRALFDLIERISLSKAPVLIRGESGTGKELIARAIHLLSDRKKKSFVAINCTAFPEALLESELFGHLKGAFTGATTTRNGLFVEADNGTLFLDEIGDMPIQLQAKLLRVLEDGEIRSVGADVTKKVDVRFIAATNQNLEARVNEGRFRSDLFFRLNVVPIVAPPLRERVEDIPKLVEYFIDKSREENPNSIAKRLTPKALAAMAGYHWPGNVRELENLVKRFVLFSIKEDVDLNDIKEHLFDFDAQEFVTTRPRDRLVTLKQMEDEYISWVIRKCGGNKSRSAEILGIDVSTIHRREKKPSPI